MLLDFVWKNGLSEIKYFVDFNLFHHSHCSLGQLMATELWTQVTGRPVVSWTHMPLSPRWVVEWGLWAQRWRWDTVLVISVWRMISAAWYMTTTAWGLHLCTLEATVPCHGLGQAQWVWTGADSGKTTKWCSALNAEYVQCLIWNRN